MNTAVPIAEERAIAQWKVLFAQDNQFLATMENNSKNQSAAPDVLRRSVIYFYFCLEGKANFGFGPHYSRDITEGKNYFFYNPEHELPFNLTLDPGTRMVILSMSLQGIHKLFVEGGEEIHFLKSENVNRKFYDEREISNSLRLVLNQLFSINLSENTKRIFFQGKVLEILSLYFSNRQPDMESCPFLNDEATVRKIKHAKEYLLKNLDASPTLKELSKLAGLNEFQLKAGFKEIYGNTVYGYLLDHKLDHARILLDTKQYKVNEVSGQIGYANTSHFIAAFKKKFGITPKKYLMR
jgi:AraC-like DNA-binding protein